MHLIPFASKPGAHYEQFAVQSSNQPPLSIVQFSLIINRWNPTDCLLWNHGNKAGLCKLCSLQQHQPQDVLHSECIHTFTSIGNHHLCYSHIPGPPETSSVAFSKASNKYCQPSIHKTKKYSAPENLHSFIKPYK